MVVNSNRKAYKVMVVSCNGTNFNSWATEVYDSTSHSWTLAAKLPRGVLLYPRKMTLCNDLLYCISSHAFNVVVYDLELNHYLISVKTVHYLISVKTVCGDEDWQDNDGALNTISMQYPCLPSIQMSHLSQISRMARFYYQTWYHTVLEADHIHFIINRDRAGVHFEVLYDSIFQRCRKQMQRSSIEKINRISMGI
ncbi:hypothetical protein O6H91_12G072400 [Diphasiastrum complanatum]|uniref:Uncharacterized protein n=1 Tax=Diphasiastrum complanatum TaxID=34168 RepID=A0ACC2C3A3_DIPCM|nr:hypothetical protein O6H91_12G072400 [Diphasiastrum complanatum]